MTIVGRLKACFSVAMISDVAELLFSSSILKTALFVSHTMTGWARCVDPSAFSIACASSWKISFARRNSPTGDRTASTTRNHSRNSAALQPVLPNLCIA
jgi:hypothetical protein